MFDSVEVLEGLIAPPAVEAFQARAAREGISLREAMKNALYAYAVQGLFDSLPEEDREKLGLSHGR